jgi:hypothetical protein
MGRRDYEFEAATAAVDGHVSEPVVRALIVGAPGSAEGTLGGALKSLFGRSRRKSGLRHQNVLVLTETSIRLFTCQSGRAWPPEIDEEIGAWPVRDVRVPTEADKKWTAFSATESGSETNYFYNITLTVPGADDPVVVQVPRTDSARATIQALEDATGSKPSKVTSRRRKKQQREQAAREEAERAESADPAD